MRYFKEKWDATPMLKPITDELSKIGQALNSMKVVQGGKVRFEGKTFRFYLTGGDGVGGAGRGFNGVAYDRAGNSTSGLNSDGTKSWVKYDLSTGIFSEEVGPPSEPWGNNEIFRHKSDIHGSLYLQ